MSLSSGSDITIPIQDSPPPPPSPYANKNDKMTHNEGTGIENKGYQPHDGDSKKKGGDKSKDHTEINMTPAVVGNGDMPKGKMNEAVNPELINMSVMGTIPTRPKSEFGPYEQMDDYFIPVNQHKKFLSRRSEKLYVTKDKRKANNWRRCLCWTFGIFFLAAIIAVAILAAVGVINFPMKSSDETFDQIFVTSTTGPTIGSIFTSTAQPSTTRASTAPIDPENNYVPMGADVEFHIQNRKFEAALANKSSETFHQLATEIQDKMKELLKERIELENTAVRVHEFNPGSVYVKLRVGWMDESMDFNKIQMNLANVTEFGGFEIMQMKSFKIANLCKFNKNNGCSHSCAYDYDLLEFICTCPESMQLGSDKKTCETESHAGSEIPPSSEEPSPEPETPSEPEVSTAAPEPEPEITPEESTDAPLASSSVAPEVEQIPIISSSSTTPEPSESVDVSEDAAQTTVSPPESGDDKEDEVQPSSSSTTSTTEQTPIVPVVTESEIKDEETATFNPSEASVTVAPSQDDEILAHSDETHNNEKSPAESSPSPIPSAEAATEETATDSEIPALRENSAEHQISPGEVLEIPTSTTTTTTTVTPLVDIDVEMPSHVEDPISSNLQRESVEKSHIPESNSNSDESSDVVVPTNAAPEVNPDAETITNSNTTNSSERIGRQELFGDTKSLLSSSSEGEATTLPPVAQNEAVAPNSGEFMVYSDNQPAVSSSQQQTSTEAVVSKEKLSLGSGSEEVVSSASAEDPGAAEVLGDRKTDGVSVTSPPRTFIGDTDVNNLDNVTEDTVNSEQVHASKNDEADGRDIAAIGNQDDLLGATFTPLTSSEELDEVEPNRDHLKKREREEIDTTLGPVILDVNESDDEEATTSQSVHVSTSTTTTTTPSPISTSTFASTSTTGSKTSAESSHESENELS